MYSSNEGLAYTYWLMADDVSRPYVGLMKTMMDNLEVPLKWDPAHAYGNDSIVTWTERSTGVHLKVLELDYEVNGTAHSKAQIQQGLTDLLAHQVGSGGAISTPFVPGSFWQSYNQHETNLHCLASEVDCTISSSWMTILTLNPLVRIYGVYGVARRQEPDHGNGHRSGVLRFGHLAPLGILQGGGCAWSDTSQGVVQQALNTVGDGQHCPLAWPYLVDRSGVATDLDDSGGGTQTESVHMPDINALICWSWFFTGNPSQKTLCNNTFKYATGQWAYFTRPQPVQGFNTEYRLGRGTARQFNWQFTNANAVMWLNSGVTPMQAAASSFSISTVSLPGGRVGSAYSQTILTDGGVGPYTFAVTSGSLPAGLSLAADGILSGMPARFGASSFTITATDNSFAGGTAQAIFTLEIAPPPPDVGITGAAWTGIRLR